jgi:glycosyltransferase involved in cell wall biosynthesis
VPVKDREDTPMPKVSVVLPVFNCKKYIKDAVRSILAQSFTDFEIVIVDDGSKDGTERIVREYGNRPGISLLVHPENMGICRSLNDGIGISAGEYIAIQHADDVSLPDRLEKQVRYLNNHPKTMLVAGLIQYVNKKGKKKKDDWWLKKIREVEDDPGIIRDTLLEQNIIPHPTVMLRKRITETAGLYDPDAFPTEDYDYWLRISEQHDIGLIHDVLCFYRRHKKQLTRTEKMQRLREKAVEAVQKARKRRGIGE